jgi:sugar/nucleoside kinase (ribokinase family)
VDLLIIGHFARDRIIVDGVAETASGGGVYYGSIALRRQGLDVGVVTRLHPADFRWLDELEREGIHVFASAAPETSGIENRYDSRDMERRICRPLGFAGAFRPEDLPPVSARIYVAAPIIAGEIDLALLGEMARRGPVALDIQGFVRVRRDGELSFRAWPDLAAGLSLVTYLKADQAEAELITGETDLAIAAAMLADCGPAEVLLTHSAGVTVWKGGRIQTAPFTSRSLAGRTGRGDTCFCTYLGQRLSRSATESTEIAAAVTTLKQEEPGPWRGSMADVEELLARRSDSRDYRGRR